MDRNEVEKKVLSCALQEGIPVEPSLFLFGTHQRIARAIVAVYEDRRQIDLVSVSKEAAMPIETVAEIEQCAPTSANFSQWTRELSEIAVQQRQADIVASVVKNADKYTPAKQAEMLLEATLAGGTMTTRSVPIKEVLKKRVVDLQKPLPPGLATGARALDRTVRFGRGKSIVLAARPGMGKTALALQLVRSFASAGTRCLCWSLEIKQEECVDRHIASTARVNVSNIDRHDFTPNDLRKMVGAMPELSELPVDFVPDGMSDLGEFRTLAIQEARLKGTRVLVVDYLQLVTIAGGHRMSTNERVAHVSRELKSLALAENLCILLLSQLNREVEKRPDPTPQLADLRDSGAIEQDADVVLMLHRPHQYNDEADPKEALVLVAKNRQGQSGLACKLVWHGEYNLFMNPK